MYIHTEGEQSSLVRMYSIKGIFKNVVSINCFEFFFFSLRYQSVNYRARSVGLMRYLGELVQEPTFLGSFSLCLNRAG